MIIINICQNVINIKISSMSGILLSTALCIANENLLYGHHQSSHSLVKICNSQQSNTQNYHNRSAKITK